MATPFIPTVPPLLHTISTILLLIYSLVGFLITFSLPNRSSILNPNPNPNPNPKPNPSSSFTETKTSSINTFIRVPRLIKNPKMEGLLRFVIMGFVGLHFWVECWAVLERYRHRGGEDDNDSHTLLGALCPSSLGSESTWDGDLPRLPLYLIILGAFIRTTAYTSLGRKEKEKEKEKENPSEGFSNPNSNSNLRLKARTTRSQLVTSGPYAYVRHPGYTGLLLVCLGYGWFMGTSGTVGRECVFGFGFGGGFEGIKSLTGILGTLYTLFMLVFSLDTSIFLIRRSYAEDELMKSQFGEEWEEWRGRVRWRVFPGVL